MLALLKELFMTREELVTLRRTFNKNTDAAKAKEAYLQVRASGGVLSAQAGPCTPPPVSSGSPACPGACKYTFYLLRLHLTLARPSGGPPATCADRRMGCARSSPSSPLSSRPSTG